MVIYECKICNFSTKRKTEYERHIKTTKHINNIKLYEKETKECKKEKANKEHKNANNVSKNANNVSIDVSKNVSKNANNIGEISQLNKNKKNNILCDLCGKIFKHRSSLSRHKSNCKGQNKNNDEEIVDLKNQIKDLVKIVNDATETANTATKTANTATKTANTATDTVSVATRTNKKTISMMSYAIDNLNDAPEIKQLEEKNIVRMLHNNKKHSLEDMLLFQYTNNMLHEYIGKVIVEHYKKINPTDQSLFSTDTSRSNFIIKCGVTKKKSEWINDKSGLKIKEIVIEPIINKIKSIIDIYTDALKNNIDYTNGFSAREQMNKIMKCMELSSYMGKKKSLVKILRFISPYFDMNIDFIDDEDDDEDDDDVVVDVELSDESIDIKKKKKKI
jgi:hypothetical protein